MTFQELLTREGLWTDNVRRVLQHTPRTSKLHGRRVMAYKIRTRPPYGPELDVVLNGARYLVEDGSVVRMPHYKTTSHYDNRGYTVLAEFPKPREASLRLLGVLKANCRSTMKGYGAEYAKARAECAGGYKSVEELGETTDKLKAMHLYNRSTYGLVVSVWVGKGGSIKMHRHHGLVLEYNNMTDERLFTTKKADLVKELGTAYLYERRKNFPIQDKDLVDKMLSLLELPRDEVLNWEDTCGDYGTGAAWMRIDEALRGPALFQTQRKKLKEALS